jgi:Hydroxyethylthiazole kinase, sugar kinase family
MRNDGPPPGQADRTTRSDDFSARIAHDFLVRLRERQPRVHAITNAVAKNFTANMLLAAGAVPSMTIVADEVADFTRHADALLVNLGTLDTERRAAIPLAIAAAQDAAVPWLLDPVFVERSPRRLAVAQQLLSRKPNVLRTNATEFAALTRRPADRKTAMAFARESGCVVALTGATDIVTDGRRTIAIANGHGLMARITAMGCAATAVVAACVAVGDDALLATASGLALVGIAGEMAGEKAGGPGTFPPLLLDALHALDEPTIAARLRCE